MNDHETYLLLAAKQMGEGLTPTEEADLDAHLATCPSCRSFIAGMRRDDILLRGQLGEVAVAPRVRQRVLDEAYGNRSRFDPRILLALAATLLLATIGIPLIVGGPPPASPQAVISVEPSTLPPTPSPSPSPSPEPSVSFSLPPSPAATAGGFVSAAYVYNEQAPRRDSVAAHFEDGQATGEWTRNQPPTGPRNSFGGPVTCLLIDGQDAWLAGPSTVDTVGDTPAVFIRLHDGGPDGEGDLALLWRANPGQTIETMEGWCRTRFSPESPVPITAGDIVIDDGSASPSP